MCKEESYSMPIFLIATMTIARFKKDQCNLRKIVWVLIKETVIRMLSKMLKALQSLKI